MSGVNTDTISIYSDASFDNASKQAVLGFSYLTNKETVLKSNKITLVPTTSLNNIRAEIESVLLALSKSPKAKNIIIYTDCAAVSGLQGRRSKLEGSNYISKSKGTELNNADLYKKFYIQLDKVSPKIVWVKGHTSKLKQSLVEKNFSVLDKAVRAKLRFELKASL